MSERTTQGFDEPRESGSGKAHSPVRSTSLGPASRADAVQETEASAERCVDETASPCTKDCRLDEDRTLCLGCQRTLAEVARWSTMSDAERIAVNRRLAALPSAAEAGGAA